MKPAIACFLFLLVSVSAIAQTFEGRIVYKINIKGDFSPQEKMMLPSEAKLFCKGDFSRMEMSLGLGMSTTTISNLKTGDATSLMNFLGSKYAIESKGADENREEYLKNAKLEVTNESKSIAGYNCKKAIVSYLDPQSKATTNLEVWFTKELNFNNDFVKGPFQKIEGAMLEFNLLQQGINMNFQATLVSLEKVENRQFEVPDGYKKLTKEELMKMMGGK
jgi:GLPGLI family protein